MMWAVCAAMLPAIAAAAYERGTGALLQTAIAVAGCMLAEAACLLWRRMPLKTLTDGSAAAAGIIIGLSLPPLAPWHVAAAAAVFAMTLAKHCYGGLGNNPFNPAMAGYALAFVSFPADFGGWDASIPAWDAVWGSAPAADGVSSPTPLAAARAAADVASESASPSLVFPLACAAGGAVLILLRVADWRLPLSFLIGAAMFSDNMESLLLGGMIMAAFFVITDPVTAAATPIGRWMYGLCGGALAALLRAHGPHADGIAFAILLCNMLAPLMDRAAAAWRRR